MDIPIYLPRIKGKNFLPNVVAKFGIPAYADSRSNPKVWGTQAHEDWWHEQFNYCINGYTTGGIFIPGRYYWYLNFVLISTVKRGNHHPEYVDIDQEYFELVEEAKATNKGIIGLKCRRRGFSEKMKGIITHGMRFQPEGYCAGVVAGLQVYSEELSNKILNLNSLVAPELHLNTLKETVTETECGWTELDTNGNWVDRGSLNKVICRTMFNNPNVMKGQMYDDVAFEEAGELDLLIKGFGATKSCFAVGRKMVGTPHVFGTGGNIKGSSAGFQLMWNKPDDYSLLRFRNHAQRLTIGFFIGSKNEDGDLVENCPNIEKLVQEQNLSREQVLGCEDVETAFKSIKAEAVIMSQARNRQTFYDFLQNNSTDDHESFLSFTNNDYPTEKLAAQEALLLHSPLRYQTYQPSWNRDGKGNVAFPLTVNMMKIDDPGDDLSIPCVYIHKPPHPTARNLFYGGIDGYDIDQSSTSKSLGSFLILVREKSRVPDYPAMMPAAFIWCRPARKEMFYDMCLMMAVHYGLLQGTMCDARSHRIIDYFDEEHLNRYLAPRPQSVESATSEQTHKWGYKETVFSKPRKIGMIQGWIYDYIELCPFPQLIKDLRDFDKEQSNSDWDGHDALGCCLIGMKEYNKPIIGGMSEDERDNSDDEDPYSFPVYTHVEGVGTFKTNSSGNGYQRVNNADTIFDGF